MRGNFAYPALLPPPESCRAQELDPGLWTPSQLTSPCCYLFTVPGSAFPIPREPGQGQSHPVSHSQDPMGLHLGQCDLGSPLLSSSQHCPLNEQRSPRVLEELSLGSRDPSQPQELMTLQETAASRAALGCLQWTAYRAPGRAAGQAQLQQMSAQLEWGQKGCMRSRCKGTGQRPLVGGS